MKLTQIRDEAGILTAAIVADQGFRLVPGQTTASLIERAEQEDRELAAVAEELALADSVRGELELPVTSPEIWACGCTYAPSAEFRDAEVGAGEGPYAYVSDPAHRPEIFFKGTARVCAGPNEPIGIRADSRFTAPEPEIALVLDRRGCIVAYTLANDVSAWDIERENALYLPQSKVYKGCCSLGPFLVTADEIRDPYALQMRCSIRREGETTFEGSASTKQLRRQFEELVEYLLRSNPIPSATVLLTGTGIIVHEDAALAAGDVVTIEMDEIGELANPAEVV